MAWFDSDSGAAGVTREGAKLGGCIAGFAGVLSAVCCGGRAMGVVKTIDYGEMGAGERGSLHGGVRD